MASVMERVLAAARERPGLDDDELAELLGIRPRQQVNQAARLLEGRGLLRRVPGPRGKLVNLPASAEALSRAPEVTDRPESPVVEPPRRRVDQGAGRRVGLVGCVKAKLGRAARARDLYTSDLFHKRVGYVERSCDEWVILSAKHGVVDPDEWLAPYDVTLKGMGVAERRAWSGWVLAQLEARLGPLAGLTFELHAGQEYWADGLRAGLETQGAAVEYPLAGLGIGEQLAWYAARGNQAGRERS